MASYREIIKRRHEDGSKPKFDPHEWSQAVGHPTAANSPATDTVSSYLANNPLERRMLLAGLPLRGRIACFFMLRLGWGRHIEDESHTIQRLLASETPEEMSENLGRYEMGIKDTGSFLKRLLGLRLKRPKIARYLSRMGR
jgi:hypothetical protein